ncbi:hypothetical protein B0I35DRAFT_444179 [Stachybotrys elegans]|uniref:Uncharacterized protein n=1 Tax=Stachybotrys elegans TaxID=80388 RepID=A0A8K0WLW1_9HYPO|nr:hypothetical protein B0I35DRAFT_444179 [Stachybotrys elegans]
MRSHDRQRQYELRRRVLHGFEQITSPGSPAFMGRLEGSVNPRLSVEGVGLVDVSLTESGARQLIAEASQAPYGRGSETLVDTAVRNTWELDARQFVFLNPQ